MKSLEEKIKLEKPLRIEADKVCIAGDEHCPFQDDDLIKELIHRCQIEKIRTIIINGDFLDCKNISSFTDLQQIELTFENELEEANRILKLISRNFDNIYFTNSNHEARFARKMEGNANIKDLFKMFDGDLKQGEDYQISIYDYCILNNSTYICHPDNYSSVPLSIPRTLATKYHMNIICGHLHRLSLGKDISGKYFCMESGGLFDPGKLEYLQNTNKNPNQESGFILIKNNIPTLIEGKIQSV